ncbi:MAG: BREX-1 system adenine-specific DNA-methyltransferase PglX [Peptococcaceae bacterium MAG4]|nr:BREX-1 system adenine-specific DNA-methyltransferase PglX [Peptococcaceae bacterium MAG4]
MAGYISIIFLKKKDEVFAGLKNNKKITKENIPAATQLFTPKWIVKYMVENSLGRLWLESHPNEELKAQWKYYLEEAEQEPEVQQRLEELINPNLNPEDIKVLDPAMGSGHILVYAFDVLYEIYLSAGYSEREIPNLILEKNLYGLDIDDRAGQLAAFVLLMKARSKNRRILRNKPKMNLCSIQESNDIPKEAIEYLVNSKETELDKHFHREDVEYLIEVFHDAKEYGSILEVKKIDFDALEKRIEGIRSNVPKDLFELQYREVILEKFPPLIEQAKIMSQNYDVVCTNPPYMGSNGMNSKLRDYLKENYGDTWSDLSTVFMERSLRLCKNYKFVSLINIPVWMFISSYENMRDKLLSNFTFVNMLHLGRGVFGSDFGTTSFVIRNINIINYKATYRKLYQKQGAVDSLKQKEIWFLKSMVTMKRKKRYFLKYQEKPIAYWITEVVSNIFEKHNGIAHYGDPKQGIATADNNRFLRLWHEVNICKVEFSCEDRESAKNCKKKWFPYNKGGEFRKWYGNNLYLINWENDGMEIRNFKKAVLRNQNYYFREGITWTWISASYFGSRYSPKGFLFDVAGSTLFLEKDKILYFFRLYVFLCC